MKKSLFPDKKAFAELQEAAENIASRKFNQMGYPFDQDTGFSEFYRWLADTGLCDITLINVGDPYKKNWDMLNTDKFERFCIDFMADACGFEGNHWGVLSNGGTDGNMHGIYFGRKEISAASDSICFGRGALFREKARGHTEHRNAHCGCKGNGKHRCRRP